MDEKYMLRAVELAKKGLGFTSPNPPVAAVIVKNNKIIAEGYHKKAGSDHAEIIALKKCKTKLKGATLYVTLEPCFHHGKTPPCVNTILESGIKKVCIGMKDPYHEVNGRSIKYLKKHGVKVEILNKKSPIYSDLKNLMQGFIKYCKYDLPYVTLKAGISLDGKIATSKGESKWITNPLSRKDSRLIRSQCDAIILGSGTAKADNPTLKTVNPYKNKNILKVVIDKDLSLEDNLNIFKDTNLLIAHTDLAQKKNIEYYKTKGVNIKSFGKKRVSINKLLKYLHSISVQSIFVEGGSEIHGSFYDAFKKNPYLIDKVLFYMSPVIIAGRNAKSVVAGEGISKLSTLRKIKDLKVKKMGDNLKIHGYLNYY